MKNDSRVLVGAGNRGLELPSAVMGRLKEYGSKGQRRR